MLASGLVSCGGFNPDTGSEVKKSELGDIKKAPLSTNESKYVDVKVNSNTWLKNTTELKQANAINPENLCPLKPGVYKAKKLDSKNIKGNHISLELQQPPNKGDGLCPFQKGLVFLGDLDNSIFEKMSFVGLNHKHNQKKVAMDNGMHQRCHNFIDGEGNIGPWGKILVGSINKWNNIFFDEKQT